MAKNHPQFLRSRDLRGGSAVWSMSRAAEVHAARYFGPTFTKTVSGKLMVWSGSAWIERASAMWDGSAWVPQTMNFWSGSGNPDIPAPAPLLAQPIKAFATPEEIGPDITYDQPVTAGNLLVVFVAQYVGNPNVTGELNGQFTQITGVNPGSQLITAWYKVATVSGVETIDLGGDSYRTTVAILEYNKTALVPLDKSGAANSKTVVANAANAQPGDLVIGAAGGRAFYTNYAFTEDPTFTNLYTQNDAYPFAGMTVGHKIETGTGPSTRTVGAEGFADTDINSLILTFRRGTDTIALNDTWVEVLQPT